MSTRTAYFNNVAFNTLGLIINETVVPPVSHQKYSTISIPDGPVIFEETGKRDPVVFSIKCTVTEANKLRDIYAMAAHPGTLILPDEPDKYYYGVLTIATPKNIILYYNKITFTMTAEPYAYSVTNPEITCTLADEGDHKKIDLNNIGTADCEPWYRFTAASTGTMKIWLGTEDGNQSISLPVTANEQISIDVTRNNVKVGATHIESRVTGNYLSLTLAPGANTLKVRNCSAAVIVYNERWY